jgi:hypothetical protein
LVVNARDPVGGRIGIALLGEDAVERYLAVPARDLPEALAEVSRVQPGGR